MVCMLFSFCYLTQYYNIIVQLFVGHYMYLVYCFLCRSLNVCGIMLPEVASLFFLLFQLSLLCTKITRLFLVFPILHLFFSRKFRLFIVLIFSLFLSWPNVSVSDSLFPPAWLSISVVRLSLLIVM